MSSCSPYRGKRFFDVVLLVGLSIPVFVVGLVCAVAVKATSPGPVFFRQARVGRDGADFEVFKFRTMVDEPNPLFPDDQRITSAGRWLRRLSLDELPQLINVARGEMSVVGPRPTLRYQVDRYDERQRRRMCVKPGVTGLAQVKGRNAIAWAERIDLDLEYLDRQSPIMDIKILGWSVGVVLKGSGVEGHPRDDPIARPPEEE